MNCVGLGNKGPTVSVTTGVLGNMHPHTHTRVHAEKKKKLTGSGTNVTDNTHVGQRVCCEICPGRVSERWVAERMSKREKEKITT